MLRRLLGFFCLRSRSSATEVGIRMFSANDFHFHSFEATEDLTRYSNGGYHPVIIGDILRSPSGTGLSYRIVQKLGFGTYATVWLAQQVDRPRAFYSLKITTADGLSGKEAQLLSSLRDKPRVSNIIALRDSFELEGPNGRHWVLVTDVIVPLVNLLSAERSLGWRKKVIKGIVKGVASLHASNIVHGDLHLGNVGIALPTLGDVDPDDVLSEIGDYQVTMVLPTDPKLVTTSLPRYLVSPCNLASYFDSVSSNEEAPLEPEAKLFDFGAAHSPGAELPSFQCAIEAVAPETAWARMIEGVESPAIEAPADVWALGSIIHEILFNAPLFGGAGINSVLAHMRCVDDVDPMREELWPILPEESGLAVEPFVWWYMKAEELKEIWGAGIEEDEVEQVIEMLKKILVLDPLQRVSASEVGKDPWLKDN